MGQKVWISTLTGNLSLVNPESSVESADGGRSGEVDTNNFKDPDGSPLSRQSVCNLLSLNAPPRAYEPTSDGYIEK